MCNLYLMLYSHLPVFMWCLDSQPWAEVGAACLPAACCMSACACARVEGDACRRRPCYEALSTLVLRLLLTPCFCAAVSPGGPPPRGPPPARNQAVAAAGGAAQPGGGDPYALGQVPGLAARGDGTVWAFHRGHRAWNPDGSVSDGGEGEVLAGPTVFQVGERTEAGARH